MSGVWQAIAEPFSWPFMQYAFAMAVIVSVPMAVLSCYLVLKGWSLMGDAISHAVLPGVVLAYILNLPLALGAFAAGMFCALATGFLSENSRVKEDTVMGVVFSGMFGVGLVMYTAVFTNVHLDHILFGDLLGVSARDLAETALIASAALAFLAAKGRDLMALAFDETHGRGIGLPASVLHYSLLAVISLCVVGALKATGIILAVALLVAPGAIGFLVARRFAGMVVVAVASTVVSALAGVWLSFHLDSAPAPTIVLILTAIFIAAFVWSAYLRPMANAG